MLSPVTHPSVPQTRFSAVPAKTAPTSLVSTSGDRVTFSGEAMNALRRVVLMPDFLAKEEEIRTLLNTDVLEGVTGLTVLQACQEDLALHKDRDGDITLSSFFKRAGIDPASKPAQAIEAFLQKASTLKLLQFQRYGHYIRHTAFGEWIAQDANIHQRLKTGKPEETKRGLL